MTHRTDRRLIVITAVLFAVSTMFPAVAAAVQPDPSPLWAGVADVALAILTCACGFTIAHTRRRAVRRSRRPGDPKGAPGSDGPSPVGTFAPNAWGLHDMHGNVWEWTADAHCDYPAMPVTDPRPTCRAPLKVIRGGSWYFRADSARCAARYTHRP